MVINLLLWVVIIMIGYRLSDLGAAMIFVYGLMFLLVAMALIAMLIKYQPMHDVDWKE